jgi:hypothetical protein
MIEYKKNNINDDKLQLKNHYLNEGFLFFSNLITDEVINNYPASSKVEEAKRQKYYLDDPLLRDILCSKEIYDVIDIIGITVALSTGSFFEKSTEEDWHRDHIWPYKIGADNYIGVWIAMEDVSLESGPFEIIPGSHKWEIDYSEFEGDLLYRGFNKLTDIFEEERTKRNAPIISFNISKGDAIFWHGHTIHRGSKPSNRALSRESLVAHYCNPKLHGTPDDELLNFPEVFNTHGAGYYFNY